MTFSLLGTSMPTAAFPGMGASIRISAAARFNLISSARFTILLTFTPISGCISYRVTLGPQLTSVMVTLTPKFFRVCCNFRAVSCKCLRESPWLPVPFFSREAGGNTYSGFGGAGGAGTVALTGGTVSLGGIVTAAGASVTGFAAVTDSGICSGSGDARFSAMESACSNPAISFSSGMVSSGSCSFSETGDLEIILSSAS